MEYVVEMKNITMDFPGIRANDDVSLSVKKGEIFALVGENGAGKSTLMNILYGILTPTTGEVIIKGKKVTAFNPKNTIAAGVGMVHQHFMLVPSFTVAQNIVMSREPRKWGLFCDDRGAVEAVRSLSEEYGLHVNPEDVVREISVGLQQRVEILKTLYRGADVLILDEPTAVLTPQETDELFAILRRVVKEKGMTVIIITHKLYEVMAISDRVAVMRQGKLVHLEETKNVTERSLAAMMVGRDVVQVQQQEKAAPGEEKIRVRDLQVQDNRGLPAVRGLSLSVRAGEVVGIAAIEGNGQSELLEAITGMRTYTGGSIHVNGTDVSGMTPGQIRDLGLSHVPEDRLSTGVSPDADITDNLLVGKHRQAEFTKFGFHQNRKAIEGYASRLFEKFDIRASGMDARVGSLSGGNMQKVVIAREFSFPSDVLVISQPTRGVDIGANEFIHSRILEKRNEGAAVLLCSADLDEVFRLSDRIVTIYEGKITGEFEAGTITKAELGYYMTGDRKAGGAIEA
ncbi:MAG: ABC transporter ATP-binding protein [Oscillospiraceae bacterium]|nr:ABC transporter ATP-binding protein [Oscillospiraceae bacterium]